MMKYEIGKVVEFKPHSLSPWYEGVVVGYCDTNEVYILRMNEGYPFTTYETSSEERIREVIRSTTFKIEAKADDAGKHFCHLALTREGFKEATGSTPEEAYENAKKIVNESDQIEVKAEELYDIYRTEDQWVRNTPWDREPDSFRNGFRAIARHLAIPQTDVQHALQAALESECELRAELEAHKQNSLQIVRLNSWLQENNLGKLGECVTDTIIELLDEAMKPKAPAPHMIRSDEVIQELEAVIAKFKPLKY